MRQRDIVKELEDRRKILHHKRVDLLGKFISEKEQRSRWLVQLMDIEDELEELSRSSRRIDF